MRFIPSMSRIRDKIPGISCFPWKNTGSFSGSVVVSAAVLFTAGILFAFCVCSAAENCLKAETAEIRITEAEIVSKIKPVFSGIQAQEDSALLVSADPFGTGTADASSTDRTAESVTLKGTLSSVAAYLDAGAGPVLVLAGQDCMGFRLVSVGAGEAVVSKNGCEDTIFMPFTSYGETSSPAAASTAGKPGIWDRAAKPAAAAVPGVQAAAQGTPGAVPRELMDRLIMNPYEEMAKIRMVPSENGMKIARIADDSILAAVGVRRDDVIKAVNGVTITNLGNANNAINSMMTGTRFDVTVDRGGAPLELKYEVR